MTKLIGVIPPMITPFKENGDIDEIGLKNITSYLKKTVQGLFICGSYGSGPLMSISERMKVAEIVRKEVDNDVKVIVHTGCASTKETVILSKHAKEIGCDAVAAVGPYYFDHNSEEIIIHYDNIISEVKEIPVYLYNNPKFQGYEIDIKTIKRLKSIGLSGIKDATFNIINYANYSRELVDDNFDAALGTEAIWLSASVLGCNAFIPGIGNVLPNLCYKMWKEGYEKKYEECKKTQFLINKVRDIMYLAPSTQLAIYCIAEILEIIKTYPRKPFKAASQKQKNDIENALNELGGKNVLCNY